MAELRRKAGVLIATGECLFTRYPFREYLVKGAVDVVQPDVCTRSGIMETFKISAMADDFFLDDCTIQPAESFIDGDLSSFGYGCTKLSHSRSTQRKQSGAQKPY